MKVVGIDFSSRSIDIVTLLLDADDPRWHRIPLEGSFPGARTMRDHLPPGSWWDDVVIAAIERPMGQNRNAIAALMRLQGAIVATIPDRVEVWEMMPSEWKLEVGLKGNADKPSIARWALDHGADESWSQDACDALGIANAALRINTRAIQEAA